MTLTQELDKLVEDGSVDNGYFKNKYEKTNYVFW